MEQLNFCCIRDMIISVNVSSLQTSVWDKLDDKQVLKVFVALPQWRWILAEFGQCVFLYFIGWYFSYPILQVRGVNLGGWLVVEGWIKPSLFDEIPNKNMLDGTQVQFKSMTLQKYVSADNGGGMSVMVDRDGPSTWETFKIWRVSDKEFQFRSLDGHFLTSSGEGNLISATADSPSLNETFFFEINNIRVHFKSSSGSYVQAAPDNQLTADYLGAPAWDDNAATFEMIIFANNLHGDYQLANGYGHDRAKEILMNHRSTFVTAENFAFLSKYGINTVRIPVGWWIYEDPDPPAPFIGGSLSALDSAFLWARAYGIKCIIDLHAAPGSQNGMEHSASRDGSIDWPQPKYMSQTLDVIDFLSARYADHPALLGIELSNEPSAAVVPIDVLISYYKRGYQIVLNYTSSAYVIICQRIGNADPIELYQADVGDSNVVLDLHYYNLFDTIFNNMSAEDNIQFIYKSRESQLQALNSANGPLVFVGEWANELNSKNATQMQYQMFGSAQLEVYGVASFGWSYWTLKNEEKHWDFEWNIRNKYLIIGSSSKMTPNKFYLFASTCGLFLLTYSGMITLILPAYHVIPWSKASLAANIFF